jgi:hypothetical protein
MQQSHSAILRRMRRVPLLPSPPQCCGHAHAKLEVASAR